MTEPYDHLNFYEGTAPEPVVIAKYTNLLGDTSLHKLRVINAWSGTNPWHPETQWFIKAVDLRSGEVRDFALNSLDFATLHEPDFRLPFGWWIIPGFISFLAIILWLVL